MKIAVLGGGSFGTAIANIIASNDQQVFQWMRSPQKASLAQQTRENAAYLPGYALHDNLTVSADLAAVVAQAELIFISIPSSDFRSVAQLLAPLLAKPTKLVSTTKGIEAQGFKLMSQVLEEVLPGHEIGVLSGPNFAKEIIAQQQTGTVVASESRALVNLVQKVLCSNSFRVYANSDRYGVELGGALKNSYAIVCGMAAALGAGHNTQAMLLTRSLAEMSRMAVKLGADPMTFLGLAGMGDLILTCTSDLSRNYRVGYGLGQGRELEAIIEELGQVAEGVNTVKLVYAKAKQLGIYMPLVSGLYAVMFTGASIADVASKLMQGEQTEDVEFSH